MDEKTLATLEFPKILERLAEYAAFSASAELIRALRPTSDREEALRRLARTSETRRLLTVHSELSVGGAHDIRPQADLAAHGGVLDPGDLLDIKSTLISARELARTFEHLSGAQAYPALYEIGVSLPPPPGLIDSISRVLSERGEVMDNASDRLYNIRRELKVSHERLMSRLERMVNDPRN